MWFNFRYERRIQQACVFWESASKKMHQMQRHWQNHRVLGLKQAMSDPSEVISQNKAYKMFGQANVMRWVKNGKLVPVAKRPGKVEYRISDLRCCQGIMQDYL